MKIFKKHGLKIIGAIILVLLIFSNLPWGKAFFKTLIILPEFVPNSPLKTTNLLTSKPQIKEVIIYSPELRRIDADLWLPKTKGKYPAAVLHLGVDVDRKDPRATKLANALARSGIATLVPNIPSLARRKVLTESTEDLIASFEYLKSHPNVKAEKVGFIGFCVSGGLVLLAAEKPEISNQVAFVVAVNPYFDLSSLYENLTLRQIKDNETITSWQPHFKTVEIYNRETIRLLENELERKTLNHYLVRIPTSDLEKGKFPSPSLEELEKLSKEARFTYEYLTNKDPQKITFYKENVTAAQKKIIEELSPSTNIDKLKAKTFILADINNVFTPFSEAKLLHLALEKRDHLFTKTKIIPEGNLRESLSLRDSIFEGVKIFGFIYNFLLVIS